ncbi:alpha/beta fold hydrolase [uncultured Jatrophihabitans sp.]|uniref:alpha/beta fold hydrolase n=1 Tax=uncultured Jatrophihabitans sp. TaxID=1610747 RepID=UPI0035CAC490
MSELAAARQLRFAGADGGTLVADAVGHGPPVVLLHGGGQTRRSWRRTAAELAAAGHTAVSVDLRGHGDSDWAADGRYGVDNNVRDLRAVLDQLDQRPALVGASMGGIAALMLLGGEPDGGLALASALVLVDVTPRLEEKGLERIRGFMQSAPDGFASMDEAADAVASYLPGRPRPRTTQGLAHNLRRQADGRWHWHWDPRLLEQLPDNDEARHRMLVAHARQVRAPTLLVHGGRSDVVSAAGVRELRELMPHAVVAEIGDARHMVAGDDNDAFTAQIVDFLASR